MQGDVETLLADLEAELAATETLPVERDASRWLGEAQAVAADALAMARESADDPARGALADRVEQVGRLLSEVDGTGHDEADVRVSAARDLVVELQQRLPAPD